MRKNSKIIRILSAFTTLASIINPLHGHAENITLPTIELNLGAIQKLKQQEKIDQQNKIEAEKAAAKIAQKAKQEAQKQAEAEKLTKKTKQAEKESKPAKKVAEVKKKSASVASKKTAKPVAKAIAKKEVAKADIKEAQKPVIEIKKDTEKKAEEIVQKQPEIKAASQPKKEEKIEAKETAIKNNEPKGEAVVIKKDVEADTVSQPETNAEKGSKFSSFWKSIPLFSSKNETTPESEGIKSEESPVEVAKEESKPQEAPSQPEKPKKSEEIVTPTISTNKAEPKEKEAAQPEKKEIIAAEEKKNSQAPEDIYDNGNVEEFLDEKKPGTKAVNKEALNNISSYTSSELERANNRNELRNTINQAKKEAENRANEEIHSTTTAPAPVEPEKKPEEIVKAPKAEPVVKTERTVIAEPVKVAETPTVEKQEPIPQEEAKEEPTEEKISAAEIKKEEEKPATPVIAEAKPEKSWQEFLMEAKRKAAQLNYAQQKQVDDNINRNSVVALKEDPKAELPKKEEEKQEAVKQAETQKSATKENAESKQPQQIDAKQEESTQIVETNEIAAPEKTDEVATEKDPETKVITNADIPAPVLKKQEKATLSSLMDRLPYFNDNKNELKNTTSGKPVEVAKAPEKKEQAPEIPEIKEVKPIAIETTAEETKQPQAAPQEQKPIVNDGILGKILDKKFTPTNQDSTESAVVVSNNTEKKLDNTIDNKIVVKKEVAPPVPDPALIETEITTAANQPANQEKIVTDTHANKIDSQILLSIAFDANNTAINDVDKERLKNLVQQMLNSGKRFKIMSYASGVDGEINSARRTSLQRAIEVRTQMIQAGLEKNRINVQAIGNNSNEQEFVNSVNIYELP